MKNIMIFLLLNIFFTSIFAIEVTFEKFSEYQELKEKELRLRKKELSQQQEQADVKSCIAFLKMVNQEIIRIKKSLSYLDNFHEKEDEEDRAEYEQALAAQEGMRKPCDKVIGQWLLYLDNQHKISCDDHGKK